MTLTYGFHDRVALVTGAASGMGLYRTKYAAGPCLEPMLRPGPRSTTVRITPAAQA